MVSNYTPHLLHRHKQQVVARAELSLLCDRAHHQTQSYVPSSQAPWNTSHHIHGQASHNTRNTPLLTTLRPSPGARSRLKCFVHPPPSVQQQKGDYKKSLCPAVGHTPCYKQFLPGLEEPEKSSDAEKSLFQLKSDFSSLSEWALPMPETKI